LKGNDRVTSTLCCNATGTHKVPVTMIGKVAQLMCFQGEGNASPLPYFSKKSALTDASVFKRWFEEVFVPEIQARIAHHVYLIMDNLGCHSSISHPQVTGCTGLLERGLRTLSRFVSGKRPQMVLH